MTNFIDMMVASLREVMVEYFSALARVLPRGLAVVVTLVLGWLLGRLLGRLSAMIVRLSRADEALKGTPLGVYMERAGYSLSQFTDLAARAIVYVFTVALAVRMIGVPEAEALGGELMRLVGRVALSVVILMVGLVVVEKIFEVAARIASGGSVATKVAIDVMHAASLVLVLAAALSVAGVDLSPFVSFATALAYGLGCGLGVVLAMVGIAVYGREVLDFIAELRQRLEGPRRVGAGAEREGSGPGA